MGERDARERFARAVDDGATHTDDQEFGPELTVVSDLRRAGAVPTADRRTRHNVAVRIAHKIAEPAELESTSSGRPARRTRRYLRPALAAAFCLIVGLGAFAVLLSESALPGDALYAVKRVRESTVLALTFDDRDQALQRLAYAAERVDELRELAHRSGDPSDFGAAYRSGLADFDSAARAASVTLTGIGTNSGGGALDKLRAWSQRQSRQLAELAPALSPAATQRQASSMALLERIEHRAAALHGRFDCYQITAGTADELGALPATGRCVPPAAQQAGRLHSPQPPANPSSGAQSPSTPEHPAPVQPQHRQASTDSAERRDAGMTEVTTLPGVTPRHEPKRFRHLTPVPAPPSVERPRLPSDVGGESPGSNRPHPVKKLRDLLDGILGGQPGEPTEGTTIPRTSAAR